MRVACKSIFTKGKYRYVEIKNKAYNVNIQNFLIKLVSRYLYIILRLLRWLNRTVIDIQVIEKWNKIYFFVMNYPVTIIPFN